MKKFSYIQVFGCLLPQVGELYKGKKIINVYAGELQDFSGETFQEVFIVTE